MNETRHLSGKVLRRALPVLAGPLGPNVPDLKILRLPQGDLAQVHNSEEPIRYLAVIELPSGSIRGNHYHRRKRETVYLIAGQVRLILEELESGARETVMLSRGDLVFIPPGIAHALQTVEAGMAIEFAPDRLNPEDSFRHVLVG